MPTDPNHYQSIGFKPSYGRVEPPHLLKRQPLESLGSLQIDLGAPIDTDFSDVARQDVLDKAFVAGEYPEVSPALSGLRRFITERRIQATQSKIERLATRQFVGKSLLAAKPYKALNDPFASAAGTPNMLRPTGFRNKLFVGGLEASHTLAKRSTAKSGSILLQNPDVKGSRQTGAVFYNQYDKSQKRLSWGERRSIGKSARHYRRNNRFTTASEKTFKTIAIGREGRLDKLVDKRNRLAVKHDALRQVGT